jgi:transglutaminase superfamily protein
VERVLLAIEIVRAYAAAHRALARKPIVEVLAQLRDRPAEARQSDALTLHEARRLGHAVSRLLALLPGDTRCLRRSLVLTRLLADRGLASRLIIGTRSGPDFLAHAWVEHLDRPVLSPGDGSFARLVEL